MTDKHSPNVVRHLEMIQDVILRMASNSFAIKRWSISTTAALVGAATVTGQPPIAFGACAPAMLYWILDAYYLSQERWFRALYDQVRLEPDAVEPFSMETSWTPASGESFIVAFVSKTEWLSHAPLVVVAAAVGIVLVLGE